MRCSQKEWVGCLAIPGRIPTPWRGKRERKKGKERDEGVGGGGGGGGCRRKGTGKERGHGQEVIVRLYSHM